MARLLLVAALLVAVPLAAGWLRHHGDQAAAHSRAEQVQAAAPSRLLTYTPQTRDYLYELSVAPRFRVELVAGGRVLRWEEARGDTYALHVRDQWAHLPEVLVGYAEVRVVRVSEEEAVKRITGASSRAGPGYGRLCADRPVRRACRNNEMEA